MLSAMRNPNAYLLAVLLAALAGCGDRGDRAEQPSAAAAAPSAAVSVDVRLASPDPGIVTVAWIFDLADEWHLYGPGLNDSGYPPSVALTLPENWSAGPLRWPVPERYLMPGDILDHVYHHRLVLLQDLAPPADVRPAEAATLTARVRWLACREACVPGQADLTVTIPGRDTPLPPAVSGLPPFPQPLPAGLVAVSRGGSTVSIRAEGARALRFFPDLDSGPYTNLVADGEAVGDRLDLRLREVDGRVGPVRGLLQVEQDDGSRLTGPIAVDQPDSNPPGG